MTTQPKPTPTAAQRTLAEYRNDRKLAEILAAKQPTRTDLLRGHDAAYAVLGNPVVEQPSLLRPTPEIVDTAKVRLGDGFISAEFPPLPAKGGA